MGDPAKPNEPIPWGRFICTGFALAAGSALFTGAVWLAKRAFTKRERDDDDDG